MGSTISSSCGIDSFGSVDDAITYLLFQAPDNSDWDIENLKRKSGYSLKNIDGISILEIQPTVKRSNKLIIFSHGNASDIYDMSIYLEKLSNSLGATVVCYDYPGYGLSMGRASEEGCNNAITITVNHYLNSFLQSNIILVGQSLGTGVVTSFITTNKWNTPVILISPYKSIPRVIYDIPTECSFKHNTFGTVYKLHKITCPVKIFHGKADEVINCSHSEYIYKNLPAVAKVFEPTYYDRIGHNDILGIIKIEDYQNVMNRS
jgi:pimeloyl-ACP methyl ester carboxylesterase